jgi:hypothetical protein
MSCQSWPLGTATTATKKIAKKNTPDFGLGFQKTATFQKKNCKKTPLLLIFAKNTDQSL